MSALTWPRPLVMEPVRPPADTLAPVNVTLPKSASERMWQSWLDDERHRDGASAIHSAEETVGLLICSCLLNVVCRVRSLIETVTGLAAYGYMRTEPVAGLYRHVHWHLGRRDELVPDGVDGLTARRAVGGRPGLFQMLSRVATETDPEG